MTQAMIDESNAKEKPSVSDKDSRFGVRYFLFRSMMIGAAFGIPGVFFPQARRILRLLRDLEPVQVATDVFQLMIVLTLLGLILQGLFHFARGALRLFFPEEKP